jgi:hypothetical protein
MNEIKQELKRKPPYVAASTLWEFLNKLKNVNAPPHLDAKELEEYGIPKHWAYHLLSALKFLNLVEKNGKTTASLQSLQMKGEEFKRNLEEVVRNAYKELFEKINPDSETRTNITNFFMKHYGISPSGAEKATTLFLDLCSQAGIATLQEKQLVTSKVKTTPNKVITKVPPPVSNVTTEREPQAPLSDIALKNSYLSRLIAQISPPDTAGKDAEAIKAEAELRKAELDRIERLLKILDGNKKESQ